MCSIIKYYTFSCILVISLKQLKHTIKQIKTYYEFFKGCYTDIWGLFSSLSATSGSTVHTFHLDQKGLLSAI